MFWYRVKLENSGYSVDGEEEEVLSWFALLNRRFCFGKSLFRSLVVETQVSQCQDLHIFSPYTLFRSKFNSMESTMETLKSSTMKLEHLSSEALIFSTSAQYTDTRTQKVSTWEHQNAYFRSEEDEQQWSRWGDDDGQCLRSHCIRNLCIETLNFPLVSIPSMCCVFLS